MAKMSFTDPHGGLKLQCACPLLGTSDAEMNGAIIICSTSAFAKDEWSVALMDSGFCCVA